VEMVSALPDAVEEPVLALLSGTSNSVSSDKSQVNIMEKKTSVSSTYSFIFSASSC
jgi:hypothetical protein